MNKPMNTNSGASLFSHSRPNKPQRSKFDLSRVTNFTCDAGMIIPFDTIPTLPNDDFEISFKFALDTLPLINASMTQYKVTTHWYYMKCRDTWEGFKNTVTKGRSGNISLEVPKVDLMRSFNPSLNRIHQKVINGSTGNVLSETELSASIYPTGSHSLASFLGVPSAYNGFGDFIVYGSNRPNGAKDHLSDLVEYLPYTCVGDDVLGSQFDPSPYSTGFNQYRYVNAMPFVMYQSIVKNNYVNENLLQDNHSLFPVEGDDHWLLPYNAQITNYIDVPANGLVSFDETHLRPGQFFDNVNRSGVFSSSDKVTRIDQLRYAMFDTDYFTSGLKDLQRGTETKLELESDFNVFKNVDEAESALSNVFFYDDLNNSDDNNAPIVDDGGRAWLRSKTAGNIDHALELITSRNTDVSRVTASAFMNLRNYINDTFRGNIGITANDFRQLIAMSVWQERNMRVDGSYNAMIFQHWLENPNSEEHKPVYIGGTSDFISFNTILQSSQSTDDSPLGSTAGRGYASGSSFVGRFHSTDYGYIMGIMIIRPNTTYMQGVDRFLCAQNIFEDFVQPEFESLSPQPIYNKEIFVSGDDEIDEDIFAYQERYTDWKVRQNVNRGLFQIAPDKDSLFSTFTQARYFNKLPELSYQFLCMSPDNMRRDFLAYPFLPTFRLQTESDIFVIRSLGYTSEPNTFGF